MRLLRIGTPGHEIPAICRNEQIFDASAVVTDYDNSTIDTDLRRRLAQALEAGRLPEIAERDYRVGPPIARPGKILCVGLNYSDHAKETGAEDPAEPIVFMKASNSIVGPNDTVLIPRGSHKTDWEIELAVVVGSSARYLGDLAEAERCIFGYTISNDISEREFQLERNGQWVKGKSCETFNPLGPLLVTADELTDPGNLALSLSVNGEPRQTDNTKNMIFSPAYLVWYLSQFMVLEPGDIVNTGTPGGVALGMTSPQYLRPGDCIDLEIECLGKQRQMVAQA